MLIWARKVWRHASLCCPVRQVVYSRPQICPSAGWSAYLIEPWRPGKLVSSHRLKICVAGGTEACVAPFYRQATDLAPYRAQCRRPLFPPSIHPFRCVHCWKDISIKDIIVLSSWYYKLFESEIVLLESVKRSSNLSHGHRGHLLLSIIKDEYCGGVGCHHDQV